MGRELESTGAVRLLAYLAPCLILANGQLQRPADWGVSLTTEVRRNLQGVLPT